MCTVCVHTLPCTCMWMLVHAWCLLWPCFNSYPPNWQVRCLTRLLKCASVIIDHYTFQLLADIALWVTHLTTKWFLGFGSWFLGSQNCCVSFWINWCWARLRLQIIFFFFLDHTNVDEAGNMLGLHCLGGVAWMSHTCKKKKKHFAGRMWSGGTRQHYVSNW